MAKAGIHPEVKEVTYTMSDNRSITLRSAYTKSNKVLLDTDIFIHSAWKADDEKGAVRNTSIVSAFRDMFGGGSLFDSGYKPIDLSENEGEGGSAEGGSAPAPAPASDKKGKKDKKDSKN